MKEKEDQTSRKEHPRFSSDLAHLRSKDSPVNQKSKKIAQKSLTEAFASSVKDLLPEISKESSEVSTITAESFVMASYPSISTPFETFTPSQITPCSKISTANRDEQICFSKIGSAEVEVVVNLLKQAQLQSLNSVDMENKSKKVLDELIKFIINEFYSLPRERDELHRLVSRNACVEFLGFLLWIVVVLLISLYFFYYSRLACSFTGLPPT